MLRSVASVLVALVALPAVARAESWSLHILGDAQLAWTDNLFSSPATPVAGAPPKEGDAYLQVRPGAILMFETPRSVHELQYTFDASMYLNHTEAWAILQRAGWRGFFTTSPRGELNTDLNASFGDATTLTTQAGASAGEIGVQRSNSVHVLQLGAGENYAYQVSPALRLLQGGALRYDATDQSATTGTTTSTGAEATGRVGLERTWRSDALAAGLAATYLNLTRPNGATTSRDDQLNLHLDASWRRDLSRTWSSVVDGGAVAIVPTTAGGRGTIQPTIGGQLAYYPDWGTATFQARRAVLPNLFIAQNTLTDSASASCWLPLPWLRDNPAEPRLTVQATLAGARVQLIDTVQGEVVSGFSEVLGDVAVGYNIGQSIGFSARYQFIHQGADPTPGSTIYGFNRSTVMLSFFGRWPERLAATVPIRQTLRVDRRNVTPIGDGTAQ
jgi:hypothetical protein